MTSTPKKTPEQVRQERNANLAKARAAKKPKAAAAVTTPKTDAPAEFFGLTSDDCCADCTPERCAIAGSLVFKNGDGTTTKEGHCGHPNKCGLQPIHKSNPIIVARYNRAKTFLEIEKIKKQQTQ